MSRKDRDRLKVLHEVRKRHITQVQAGKELAISPRCVAPSVQPGTCAAGCFRWLPRNREVGS